jgi:hypothetical protein
VSYVDRSFLPGNWDDGDPSGVSPPQVVAAAVVHRIERLALADALSIAGAGKPRMRTLTPRTLFAL